MLTWIGRRTQRGDGEPGVASMSRRTSRGSDSARRWDAFRWDWRPRRDFGTMRPVAWPVVSSLLLTGVGLWFVLTNIRA